LVDNSTDEVGAPTTPDVVATILEAMEVSTILFSVVSVPIAVISSVEDRVVVSTPPTGVVATPVVVISSGETVVVSTVGDSVVVVITSHRKSPVKT
jgi:hypothetical protein